HRRRVTRTWPTRPCCRLRLVSLHRRPRHVLPWNRPCSDRYPAGWSLPRPPWPLFPPHAHHSFLPWRLRWRRPSGPYRATRPCYNRSTPTQRRLPPPTERLPSSLSPAVLLMSCHLVGRSTSPHQAHTDPQQEVCRAGARTSWRSSSPATRLKQEPHTPLGLIDPVLDEARGCDVAQLVHYVVHFTQTTGQRLVVLAQLGEHIERIDVVGIVVLDSLQAGNVPDRAEGRTAYLANALGNRVGHPIQLIGLLIQQEVIVPEVRAAHVPVEVLSLQVQSEHIGEDRVHGT